MEHWEVIATIVVGKGSAVRKGFVGKGSGKEVVVGLSNVDSIAQDDSIVVAKEPMH